MDGSDPDKNVSQKHTIPPLLPSVQECHLLRLMLSGQTVGEAAESLHLAPEIGREMLAVLMQRYEVTLPRQLLTRALVHGWI